MRRLDSAVSKGMVDRPWRWERVEVEGGDFGQGKVVFSSGKSGFYLEATVLVCQCKSKIRGLFMAQAVKDVKLRLRAN